jgi:hypothetical protein
MNRGIRLTATQLENISIFLKLLYETTKDSPKILSITQDAKAMNVPYYANIGVILRAKGIIKQKPNGDYKHLIQWASTTEPNNHMRDAIVEELRLYSKVTHQKRVNNAEQFSTATLAPVINDTAPIVALKGEERIDKCKELLGRMVSGTIKNSPNEQIIGELMAIHMHKNTTDYIVSSLNIVCTTITF